ncbi:hypothetical protein HW115_12625 [Verrucomicrobiaceae bacterium N1E253]|uniref:SH3 domain-containing protein n=1 Tax=Oceaniferula marina TaxID=2748318 RepID=A0A851GGZ1_9BACT|nr:hypothetical protein [Oceaniferula marina]NWK56459.1 hypothetical protein [Oceaniferula marina]
MKQTVLFSLSSLALVLASCDFNQPLPGGDAYNPLYPPGGAAMPGDQSPAGPSYATGSFLQTLSDNTAFFSRYPTGDDQPNKMLKNFTDVKVISTKGAYVKVEVVNNGDVGFVPSVMLGEKRSPNEVQVTGGPGAAPLTPDVPPPAEVPDIQPPEVGDPSRPAE